MVAIQFAITIQQPLNLAFHVHMCDCETLRPSIVQKALPIQLDNKDVNLIMVCVLLECLSFIQFLDCECTFSFQFSGICLKNRYGEDVREALLDKVTCTDYYSNHSRLHNSYRQGVSFMPKNMQLQFLPTKEGNATNRNYNTYCQENWL